MIHRRHRTHGGHRWTRPGPLRALGVPVALVLAAVGLSACGSSEAQTADGRTVIRYQSGPGMVNHLELADALGYLDGISLEYLGQVAGGPEALRSLATKQTDLAVGPFHGAIAKVRESGVDVTAVAATYGSFEDVDMQLLTTADSDIRAGKDLIGKKVAVNTLGANSEAVIDTFLTDEGLSAEEIAEVTLVPLPSINQESALREGQVDAALMAFASKEFALSTGGLRTLATDTEFVGDYNGGSYTLRDDFIEGNEKATEALVAGIAKAIEYTQTHSVEDVRKVYGEWLTEHDRAEEIEVLKLWNGNGVATPGGVLRDEDFAIWLEWLEAEGEVDTGSLDVGDLYTNEFNPYTEESADE